jgi:hypothetical protein
MSGACRRAEFVLAARGCSAIDIASSLSRIAFPGAVNALSNL